MNERIRKVTFQFKVKEIKQKASLDERFFKNFKS